MATVTERHDVVVIGAGQAGLAASYELTSRGVDHVVLERSEIGHAWSTRWDSFCLVTPNWSIRLPGGPYDGPDPDGYLARDEIVAHLERYAASFDAPVRTGVDVRRVQPSDDGFSVATGDGVLPARSVIVATGTYARPHLPPGADSLPASIARLAIVDYGNPGSVPDGSILVIGSGQSGCQIAEELLEAGRDVVLACGRAPWVHRRFSGHDMAWWSDRDGFLDMPVDALPSAGRRAALERSAAVLERPGKRTRRRARSHDANPPRERRSTHRSPRRRRRRTCMVRAGPRGVRRLGGRAPPRVHGAVRTLRRARGHRL
jgi:putative flavoprotein involved in K+ transport